MYTILNKLHYGLSLKLQKNYHGFWNQNTGANTPLNSQDDLSISSTVCYYVELGMPRAKIILGIATFGRSWTLDASDLSNNIGSPANGGG